MSLPDQSDSHDQLELVSPLIQHPDRELELAAAALAEADERLVLAGAKPAVLQTLRWVRRVVDGDLDVQRVENSG